MSHAPQSYLFPFVFILSVREYLFCHAFPGGVGPFPKDMSVKNDSIPLGPWPEIDLKKSFSRGICWEAGLFRFAIHCYNK